MRHVTKLSVIVTITMFLGCGDKKLHSEQQIQRARDAITTALTTWQSGEAVEKLKVATDPIDFRDDARRNLKLVDFTVGAVDAKEPKIRVTVSMKVKDRKGNVASREAIYIVDLSQTVIITNDPYF